MNHAAFPPAGRIEVNRAKKEGPPFRKGLLPVNFYKNGYAIFFIALTSSCTEAADFFKAASSSAVSLI